MTGEESGSPMSDFVRLEDDKQNGGDDFFGVFDAIGLVENSACALPS